MLFPRMSVFIINLVIMLGLSSCSCEHAVSQKNSPKFVIVNVLDKEVFDDCHIKGSIQVPFMELDKYALQHWNKETTEIVVHCSNYACTASGLGYKMLTHLGFKHVWAYEGGTAEAKNVGIPVEGACNQSYLQQYQKPESYVENEMIHTISVENLKKKIEEYLR